MSKFLTDLDMKNEKDSKILDTVIKKALIGKSVVVMKQVVKVGVDDEGEPIYDGKDIKAVVAEGGCLINMDTSHGVCVFYVTMRNMKRGNIKEIQNLWKTVRDRGMARYLEGEDNDYYMTLDCVTIEESKERIYTFGSYRTPIFCSSDGDEDLCLVYVIDDCFIDVSRYDKKQVEYEAAKLAEAGLNAGASEEDEAQEKKGVVNDSVLFKG